MSEIKHCQNFNGDYQGCRECPGRVDVTQADGTVDTICRAGEGYIRALIASSEQIQTLAEIMPEVMEEIRLRQARHEVVVLLRAIFD